MEFKTFPKIARLSRDCVITEKIDGTSGQIVIENGAIVAIGSRNRYLDQTHDNYGFFMWVQQNYQELLKLGDGTHFGEWWGLGIQRKYDLFERRFSLFRAPKGMVEKPACVSFVPVLFEGPFTTENVNIAMDKLKSLGSVAAPGYMNPEGIVIYHKAAGVMFKKTFDGDEKGKEQANAI